MGDLIGGLIGAGAEYLGSKQQAKSAKEAAKVALTGYNYLTSGAGKSANNAFINAGTSGLAGQGQTQAQIAALLGVNANPEDQEAAQAGFNNYLNSTAYNFQLGQGQNAVTSNRAARGLVNSGGTLKALTQYGQNLAGTTFNNYLAQLGALGTAQAQRAQLGQNALGLVANAGSAGGGGAAQAIMAGGNARAGGTVAIGNALGNAIGGGITWG